MRSAISSFAVGLASPFAVASFEARVEAPLSSSGSQVLAGSCLLAESCLAFTGMTALVFFWQRVHQVFFVVKQYQ